MVTIYSWSWAFFLRCWERASRSSSTVASAVASEIARPDLGGDEWFDLGSAWQGTKRLDVTDSVLALGRGNATRLGEGPGAERGPKLPGLGESGGDGNGTEGGGPLDVFVVLDVECLDFMLEDFFGTTGESLKLVAE